MLKGAEYGQRNACPTPLLNEAIGVELPVHYPTPKRPAQLSAASAKRLTGGQGRQARRLTTCPKDDPLFKLVPIAKNFNAHPISDLPSTHQPDQLREVVDGRVVIGTDHVSWSKARFLRGGMREHLVHHDLPLCVSHPIHAEHGSLGISGRSSTDCNHESAVVHRVNEYGGQKCFSPSVDSRKGKPDAGYRHDARWTERVGSTNKTDWRNVARTLGQTHRSEL